MRCAYNRILTECVVGSEMLLRPSSPVCMHGSGRVMMDTHMTRELTQVGVEDSWLDLQYGAVTLAHQYVLIHLCTLSNKTFQGFSAPGFWFPSVERLLEAYNIFILLNFFKITNIQVEHWIESDNWTSKQQEITNPAGSSAPQKTGVSWLSLPLGYKPIYE